MKTSIEPSEHYKALSEQQKAANMIQLVNKLDEGERQFLQDYTWDVKKKAVEEGKALLIAGTIKAAILIGLGILTSKILF